MIKQTLMRVLPKSWVQTLKKWYFPRVLKKVQDHDWPYALVVQKLIKPGDLVLDIGANIGYVSSLLSRYVTSSGKVYSFEPIPDTYKLLSHGLRRAGINNVKTFNCALSSEAGTAEMEVPHFPEGGENFYQSHIVTNDQSADAGSRTFSVELCKLDELIGAEISAVTFVKIDVEGHELSVLQGADGLLRSSQPAMIIEVNGIAEDTGTQAQQVFDFLHNYGYAAWVQQNNKLLERQPRQTAVDYYFLQPAHVASLRSQGTIVQLKAD